MQENNKTGFVYHIDIELLRKARERGLQLEIQRLDEQIKRHENDLSRIKSADSLLCEIQAILLKMRGIAMEVNTNPDADRENLKKQFAAYKAKIDEIAAMSEFGGADSLEGIIDGINRATLSLKAVLMESGQSV